VISGKLSRGALFLALALALFLMASAFLIAAVGFGFERGEIANEGPEAQQRSDDLDRAANIASGLFLAAELGAALLVLKSGAFSPVPIHWTIKFVALFVGLGGYSYGLVFLSLSGGAPRVLTDIAEALGNLIAR
jgi:hypothetical protein